MSRIVRRGAASVVAALLLWTPLVLMGPAVAGDDVLATAPPTEVAAPGEGTAAPEIAVASTPPVPDAPEPALEPAPAPEPVWTPEPVQTAPEAVWTPEPVQTAPEPVWTPEPTPTQSTPAEPVTVTEPELLPAPPQAVAAPSEPAAAPVTTMSKSSPLPLPGVPPGAYELNNLNGTGVADGCATQCWNTVEWYEWVSPTTGSMLIRAKSVNGWDNTLEVWLDGTTLLVQNDDAYGLDSQVIFEVQAGARYVVGLGGYTVSSQGVAIVTFLTGAPTPPADVTAVGAPNEATVSWSSPEASAESVSEYRVRRFRNGVQDGDVTSITGFPPATSLTVTGLVDYETYTFTVSAVNALGESAPSNPSNPVVPRPPLAPPTQLPAPVAVNIGGDVRVTWQESSADEVTGYSLWRYVGGVPDGPATNYPAGTLAATVQGLTPGATYTFRIQATNPAGTSPLSDPSNPVTPIGPPSAPGRPTLDRDGPGALLATWSPPASDGGRAITGYTLTLTPGGETCTTGPAVLQCRLTGLTNGQPYRATVTASNSEGTSPPSQASSAQFPQGPPTAPSDVALTRAGSGELEVSWTAAADEGSPITGYLVTAEPGGATCTADAATTCLLTGLTNGTPYTATVVADNAIGTSPASAPSAPEFPIGPPTAPGKPIVVAAAAGQAKVTWTAPESDEGAEILGYRAVAAPGGAECTAPADALTCTISGLADLQEYTVTVVARNEAGTSPASPPSEAYVQQTPGQSAVTITFEGAIGTEAGDMQVSASGGGLKAFSTVTFTVFSTPQEVGSAAVAVDGTFAGTANLPANLDAGSHRFVVTGVDPADTPVTSEVPFIVDQSGRVVSINGSPIPVPPTPPVPPAPPVPPVPPVPPAPDPAVQAVTPAMGPQTTAAGTPVAITAFAPGAPAAAVAVTPTVQVAAVTTADDPVGSAAADSASSGAGTGTSSSSAGGAGSGGGGRVAAPPADAGASGAQEPGSGDEAAAYGPYDPAQHAAALLAGVATSSLAILSMAGGRLGLGKAAGGGGSSDEDDGEGDGEEEEEAGLEGGESEYAGFVLSGNAWGDVSKTWAVVLGLPLVDRWSRSGPVKTAAVSPMLARIFADGSYLRAALGSMWFLFPLVGAILGGWVAAGGPLVAPPIGLLLACVVLGVLDATAGLAAAAGYLVVALIGGQLVTADSWRLALGVMSLWVLIPLIAAAARPFTRFGEPGAAGIFDRVADYVIASTVSAWLAVTIVESWPGLAGVDIPVGEFVGKVALVALAALVLRLALESVIKVGYPKRREWCDPGELPGSSTAQQIAGVAVALAAFLFIASAFLGGKWQLWVAALVIFTPAALGFFEDAFPNSERLHRWLPAGIAAVVAILIIEGIASGAISRMLAGSPEELATGFVIMAALATAIAIIEIFGREGDEPELTWTRRILGIGVFVLGVWLVVRGYTS